MKASRREILLDHHGKTRNKWNITTTTYCYPRVNLNKLEKSYEKYIENNIGSWSIESPTILIPVY